MIRTALDNERGFNDYARVALMLDELAWVTAASGDHREAGGSWAPRVTCGWASA